MWWSNGSGLIELNITKKQAEIGFHSGDCENDVNHLMQIPAIKRQLNKLKPALVIKELQEYGCWDDVELSIHKANLQRILWLACGDILEGRG